MGGSRHTRFTNSQPIDAWGWVSEVRWRVKISSDRFLGCVGHLGPGNRSPERWAHHGLHGSVVQALLRTIVGKNLPHSFAFTSAWCSIFCFEVELADNLLVEYRPWCHHIGWAPPLRWPEKEEGRLAIDRLRHGED